MADPVLPPLKPIPIKDRLSVLFVEKGQLDVLDGAFVLVDKNGVRTHIPVGAVACLMLEPGTRVSHAAAVLASRVGCLLVWVGEAGVRLYSAGQPGGARADRLLYQAKLALDDVARLKVVRKMYELRFKEKPPERRSVEQLRGIEGAAGAKNVRIDCQTAQGAVEKSELRLHGMGQRRYTQPLPILGYCLPLWHLRGSHSGSRLCTGCRVRPHRKAPILCLRYRRYFQIRYCRACRFQGGSTKTKKTGERGSHSLS